MENFKIKAITDTVIKHLPVDSKQLSESQKFSCYSGSELEINSYTLAPENHWELELKLPREGVSKWFAYQPHVEILGTRK